MQAGGLQPRPQQLKLMDLMGGGQLFAQAGTGTGKSYALLSAAVDSKRRTGKPSVVVCPTNALVDQYVHKDGPRVADATNCTFTHLKGRNRYLCASAPAFSELGRAASDAWQALVDQHGIDLDQIPGHPADRWGCPGSKRCAGDSCGALLARQLASKFDVIITNAHVVVWDRRVRDWTDGAVSLLPTPGMLLVDECHELDAVGRSCLSDQISPRSRVYGLVPGLSPWVRGVASALKRSKQTERLFEPDAKVRSWQVRVSEAADDLQDQIDDQTSSEFPDWDQVRHLQDELATHRRFLDLFKQADQDGTRFITTVDSDANLNRICVDASPLLGRVLRRQPSVLVSGTVPHSLPARVGVPQATVTDVGHPFDYGRSRLVISKHSAKNTSPMIRHERVASLVEAIRQTGGGTLVLFTSWADLESVMPKVAKQLPGIAVYAQSREQPQTLKDDIEAFRADGNAVLAGVRSLFTGIDIAGDALRQVIIWKLPYPVPTLERQAIEGIHGRQVYYDEMLTLLAQGIGRLVRTVDDRGRVLILDSRARGQRWPASTLTAHLAEFNQ